jgi:DNA-binding PadR family transcriptional regulator
MNPARLEDFRFPTTVSTSDRRWPTLRSWQRAGWISVKPEAKDRATVTLTDAGLTMANQARERPR